MCVCVRVRASARVRVRVRVRVSVRTRVQPRLHLTPRAFRIHSCSNSQDGTPDWCDSSCEIVAVLAFGIVLNNGCSTCRAYSNIVYSTIVSTRISIISRRRNVLGFV